MMENSVLKPPSEERGFSCVEAAARPALPAFPDIDAHWHPAELLARSGNRRLAVEMLHRAGVLPEAGDACCEVGYGTRGWLGALIDWGVREDDLHGIELDLESARQARAILPRADLRVGSAVDLPWPDGRFRLVIASTVFTSILDSEVRARVAGEIARVLAPGGALLWYDFKYDNPRNPRVRKVTRAELGRLFPGLRGDVRSLELAPPLARRIAPKSMFAAYLLERVPFLRTHLMAVLVKPL